MADVWKAPDDDTHIRRLDACTGPSVESGTPYWPSQHKITSTVNRVMCILLRSMRNKLSLLS